jgi:hypothetical protein
MAPGGDPVRRRAAAPPSLPGQQPQRRDQQDGGQPGPWPAAGFGAVEHERHQGRVDHRHRGGERQLAEHRRDALGLDVRRRLPSTVLESGQGVAGERVRALPQPATTRLGHLQALASWAQPL